MVGFSGAAISMKLRKSGCVVGDHEAAARKEKLVRLACLKCASERPKLAEARSHIAGFVPESKGLKPDRADDRPWVRRHREVVVTIHPRHRKV